MKTNDQKPTDEITSPFVVHVIQAPDCVMVNLEFLGDGKVTHTLATVATQLVSQDEPETAEAFASFIRVIVATAQRQALVALAEAQTKIILPH